MSNRISVFAVIVLAVAASTAMAVKPGQWVQDTEAAFNSASLDQTVVTNLGRVELSRASEKLASLKDDATIIYDMVIDSAGTTWLAVGPTGELASLDKDNKVQSVARYPDQQVFALATDGNALWVAVSGKTCKLEKREGDKVVLTITVPETRYIWDMLIADGKIFLATGTDGRVLEIDPTITADKAAEKTAGNAADKPAENAADKAADNTAEKASDTAADIVGKPVVVLKCEQNNVLCLGIDAQKRLYAGTDTEGLVYRMTPQANDEEHPYSAYVLYDAVEPEIGTMIVMPDGTVFAGTADANQAKPGRLNEASKDEQGKPAPASSDTNTPGGAEKPAPSPIPAPPDNPQPPAPPAPQPQPGDAAKAAPAAPAATAKPAATPAPAPAAPDQKEPADAETAPRGLLSLPMTQAAVTFADGDLPAPGTTDNPGSSTSPTKAQYDKLRVLIGRRLIEARKTGSLASGNGGTSGSSGSSGRMGPRRAGASANGAGGSKPGNAVYRISPDGFASEVFRESVMILKMAMVDGKLIIATGNEGQIYRIDPTGQEVTVLADLESQQVPAMLVHDGQIYIGSANPAQVVRLTAGYAHTGSFTADPLDAAQISHWGQLNLVADLPPHASITISTRSGNIADPDNGFWSEWSAPAPVAIASEGQPFFLEVVSPPARFIQYKLAMTSDGSSTPSVSLVSLKYLMPNLAPRVTTLRAKYPDLQIKPDAAPSARNTMNVEWEANDPNSDTLSYTLEARRLGTDQPFVKIAGDMRETNYSWNTLTMPDGRYELRVTADDSADNVPGQVKSAQRLSAPVVIDNTAPVISDLSAVPAKANPASVLVTGKIADKMSIIADIRYCLSSQDKSDAQPAWNAVLPVDQIDDSTNESLSFTIPPLAPGVRVLTIRATDAQGNTAYQSITVSVPKP